MAVRRMNLVVGARLASSETYCPTLADFDIPWGNVTVEENGWRVQGAGGVHGRTSWNLLGGSIEFDMDVCGAQPGINSNFYMISPEGGPSSGYCDIQGGNDSPICMELDMVESNGQCLGRTTWHVWGDHDGGCDQNGCFGQYHLDDGCKFHMRTEFGEDGSITQYRNGQVIQVSVAAREKNEIMRTMERAGSAIASTQWVGWVPDDGSCDSGGDLTAAQFAITNVVVNAPRGIRFGPTPPVCATPPPPTAGTYCPTLADSDVAWGEVTAEDNGWRVHGAGGVYGRTSWNLLGGYIEFDMDVCGAQPSINSNFYMISPEGGPSSGYCDIQVNDSPICMELDMVENNGQCLGQTTWHVWGDRDGGCDQSGCYGQYHLDDGCKFHMRTEFGEDGTLTQYRNGQVIQISVAAREKNEIKRTMERVGASIASTQWEGWAPDDGSCKSGGDMDAAEFAITNVVVHAPHGITFGPAPPVCAPNSPLLAV